MPRVRILIDADFHFGDGTETGESITIDLTTVSSNREALSAAVQTANVALDDLDRRQTDLCSAAVVRPVEEAPDAE